jgi:N utilization substance protein B
VLYQLDANEATAPLTAEQGLARFFGSFPEEAQIGGEADSRRFTEELVGGVWEKRAAIDAAVQQASRNWRLERMARVDRNILRLAAYEILHRTDVPHKVVINEAIEIAKRFGTADSSAFVNGVLDRLMQEVPK